MSNKAKAPAVSNAKADEKMKISDHINLFLRKNRVAILVVIAVIILAIIGLGVWSAVHERSVALSTSALESVEADYDAYLGAAEADKAAKGDAILAAIDGIQKRYGKTYASLRSAVVKAKLLYERKDIAGAEAAYQSIANADPSSHLAPTALVNAAAMAEERGDLDAAIAHLEAADQKYPDAPGASRVIFSIGRLYESQKQYAKATEAYARLVAKGADDDWTKLCRDRIIFLAAQGLSQ